MLMQAIAKHIGKFNHWVESLFHKFEEQDARFESNRINAVLSICQRRRRDHNQQIALLCC